MSCGCRGKRTATELDKIRLAATRESEIDKTDYVIYEENGKRYYDRKSCWEKAGKPGRLAEIIFFV